MKYIDYAFKAAIIVLISASLFYLVRLTTYVDQIGLMIYKDTRVSNNVSELPEPVGGSLYSGSDSAKVKITVFVDFQCPFCKQFFNQVIPEIEERYVRNGVASIYIKYLPLSHIHPDASLYAKGAEYSRLNGVFREYVSAIFSEESELNTALLNEILFSLSIDTIAFQESLSDVNLYLSLEKDQIEAGGYGISGTPTTVINKKVILGVTDFENYANIIENEKQTGKGLICQ